MTRLRTITVVVRENDTPYPPVAPWPLLYTVEVPVGPIDDAALLRQIADIRVDELGPAEAGHGGALVFHEINYGDMPDEISDALEERRISYIWAWAAGDGYGPGVTIYDGDKDERAHLGTTSEGEIMIPLSKATRADISWHLHWGNAMLRIMDEARPTPAQA